MTDDSSEPAIPQSEGDLAIREPPKVLVPVEVLEGKTIPDTLVDFLAPSDVVVLGYHVLPDQTPTEQASMQFEDRAQQAVADIAAAFRDAGREVETRVAFTHDEDQTIDRVAAEVGATALLLSNPVGEVRNVLVPIRGAVDTDRLADLVATLAAGEPHSVTLWGLGSEGFDADSAVADTRATLQSRGLDAARIATETSDVEGSSIRAVVGRSDEFDVIVMGEGEESLFATVLGEDEQRIAEATVAPVLAVRATPSE